MRDKIIAVVVWGSLIGLMVWGLRQPADRVYIEEEGTMYIDRPRWWGLSHDHFPARLHGTEWQIKSGGEWIKYEFPIVSDEPAPDPRF